MLAARSVSIVCWYVCALVTMVHAAGSYEYTDTEQPPGGSRFIGSPASLDTAMPSQNDASVRWMIVRSVVSAGRHANSEAAAYSASSEFSGQLWFNSATA